MRQAGITGLARDAERRTTIPDSAKPKPPDLVTQAFVATRPNQLRGIL